MHQRDINTIDPAQQKLTLADDVVVWPVRERGETVYRLEIPSLHKFFRVGYEEYVLISLLDGNTTLPQACGLAAAKLKHAAPTSQQSASIAQWLVSNQLAHPSDSPPPSRDPSRPNQSTATQTSASPLARWNPFWFKIPLTSRQNRSTSWVDPIADPLRFAFAPFAVLLGCLLIAAGSIALIANWNQFTASAQSIIHPSNWVWLLATWVALKIVHELGHAAACHRHGGSVTEAGIVLVLFAPLAYVDVSSCWRMRSHWHRIGVSIAGMYVEWVIAALAVMLLTQTDSPTTEHLLHNLIVAAGVSTLLFNANVLMRFDGYFVLADLVDMPNLYGEATSELKRLAQHALFRQNVAPVRYVGWRLLLLRIYAVAALGWKVVVCLTLLIAAATMFSGGGLALAALGAAMWFARPMHQVFSCVRQQWWSDPAGCVRGCLLASTAATAVIAIVGWIPLPVAVHAPAVVRFTPESQVRSGSDGFLASVHVRDSMVVQPGDLLVELQNPELRLQLAELKIERSKTEIDLRGARQDGDASLQQVLTEQSTALDSQIAVVQSQVDALRLTAKRQGNVIARDLDRRIGTLIQEGDTLLQIATQEQKEVIAIVHQDQVGPLRHSVGKRIPIRTASFRRVNGTMDQVEPRAKFRLDAPALAATQGGPLAVRANNRDEAEPESSDIRLLQPHFTARISLDPATAATLPAGMRLDAFIGYRADTIAQRISTVIDRLWNRAHDAANSN